MFTGGRGKPEEKLARNFVGPPPKKKRDPYQERVKDRCKPCSVWLTAILPPTNEQVGVQAFRLPWLPEFPLTFVQIGPSVFLEGSNTDPWLVPTDGPPDGPSDQQGPTTLPTAVPYKRTKPQLQWTRLAVAGLVLRACSGHVPRLGPGLRFSRRCPLKRSPEFQKGKCWDPGAQAQPIWGISSHGRRVSSNNCLPRACKFRWRG